MRHRRNPVLVYINPQMVKLVLSSVTSLEVTEPIDDAEASHSPNNPDPVTEHIVH